MLRKKKNPWYDFSVHKFAKTCFVAQYLTYPDIVLCTHEKYMYSDTLVWNVLDMSVRVIWSVMFFKTVSFFLAEFFFFFGLGDLVIVESGLLKPPTIIVLPISPLSCVNTSSIYLRIPMMSIDIYNLLMNSPVYRYAMTFLSPVMDFD